MSLPPSLFAAIDEAKENAVKSGVGIKAGWGGIMVTNALAGYAHPLMFVTRLLRRLSMRACNEPEPDPG